MAVKSAKRNWAVIESEGLDADKNWVQVAFRWVDETETRGQHREYLVIGAVNGVPISEVYDYDEAKILAYQLYEDTLERIMTSTPA